MSALQPDVMTQPLTANWMCCPGVSNDASLGNLPKNPLPESFKATVPGTIHTDLLQNRLIEDPYCRDNEQCLQWIGYRDWTYRTVFTPDASLLGKKNIELIFEGLDTYADVILNGRRILSADNMFRKWTINIKKYLAEGENELEVHFRSVFRQLIPKWKAAPFRLQAVDNNDQADIKLGVYSRKAGFHFGWDWGPRLVTCGIWRPVYLKAWDDIKIELVHYIQNHPERGSDTLVDYVVDITADVEITTANNLLAGILIRCEGHPVVRQDVSLKKGTHTYRFGFRMINPHLWWCQGMGKPHLYNMSVGIRPETFREDNSEIEPFVNVTETANGKQKKRLLPVSDHKETRIGIRKIELVRNKDQHGRSFYFVLNEKPVFIKGANYIPQDNFQNRVGNEQYESLLESAVAVGMTMLRVWGGGIYEDDLFYDLCDQKGILVWQDMMFACGMFPADPAFLENARMEVLDNVKRLRNHPSIALWCGNNENEMIWYNGWKPLYDKEEQKRYEADMARLFHEVIPRAINEADGQRDYIPTSPLVGYDGRPNKTGNVHYWDVWHGLQPFESYRDHIGRFMTEYGFQSFPEWNSVLRFTEPQDHDILSPVMEAHQRCMADGRKDRQYGNRLIADYMDRYYRKPIDFESFLYLSSLLQAKGVGLAIESHRLHRKDSECMGTLFWQLNDCWPAVSWSSIDYYGQWKALHYHLRSLYQDILLAGCLGPPNSESLVREDTNTGYPDIQNSDFSVFVVSDRDEPIEKAQLQICASDFLSKKFFEKEVTMTVPAGDTMKTEGIPVSEMVGGFNLAGIYVTMKLINQNKQVVAHRVFTFLHEKELFLPDPELTVEELDSEKGRLVRIQAKTFAKNVFIRAKSGTYHCSDNYFDMEAGESKEILITDGFGKTSFKGSVLCSSLADHQEPI